MAAHVIEEAGPRDVDLELSWLEAGLKAIQCRSAIGSSSYLLSPSPVSPSHRHLALLHCLAISFASHFVLVRCLYLLSWRIGRLGSRRNLTERARRRRRFNLWVLMDQYNSFRDEVLRRPLEAFDASTVLGTVEDWTRRLDALDAEDATHPRLLELYDTHQTHLAPTLHAVTSGVTPAEPPTPGSDAQRDSTAAGADGSTKVLTSVLGSEIQWRLGTLRHLAQLAELLGSPCVRPRHFERLSIGLGREVAPSTTVADFEAMGLRMHDLLVRCIAGVAVEEAAQQRELDGCVAWWADARLPLSPQVVPLPREPSAKPDPKHRKKTSRERWQMVAKWVCLFFLFVLWTLCPPRPVSCPAVSLPRAPPPLQLSVSVPPPSSDRSFKTAVDLLV